MNERKETAQAKASGSGAETCESFRVLIGGEPAPELTITRSWREALARKAAD